MNTSQAGAHSQQDNGLFSLIGIDDAERLSLGHVAAGLATVMLTGAATSALAQDSALPQIDVQGTTSPDNTLQAPTGISRLGRVQDIPQTVTVITEQTMREQGVTTLDQALRNVPGVTVAIGEGGGGLNGDQFRIRGFQAKGDLYIDGLRDFGVYQRDSFAFESVQVLKGPSSESFGVGTTGGAINMTLKNAKLGNFMDIEGVLGMGPLFRGVADVNRQIDATTAARLVVMGNKQDIVDRDHLFNDRWGAMGSVAFGLGTNTTWTLNILHQQGERLPDMGQPIITPPGQIGRPIGEFGVRRANYYGKDTDLDDYRADLLTSRFKSEVTNWLTISNDTRVASYSRYFAQTVVNCPAPACVNGVASGNFNVPYGFGGPAGYNQDTWAAQNITTAVAKFRTGGLRHELIAGIDAYYVSNERQALLNTSAKVPGTIGDPNFFSTYAVIDNPLDQRKASGGTVAGFISDRLWFTDQLSILGGVRVDHYTSKYQNTIPATGVWNPEVSSDQTLASPKASIILEPTSMQTFYVTWARSYSNLAGQFPANDLNVIANQTLQPEENDLWEAGGKVNFLGGRLGVTGAAYRVTKSNSVQTDPITGDIVQTNETQRVQGIELGVTGKVTDEWTVQFGYAYMDSIILTAPPATAANIGNRVAFVPDHAASLWTTYDIAPWAKLPGKLLIGGGVFYTSSYYVNSANTALIPSATILNGMISHEYKNYRVAVNVYNLTDELYYDSAFGNRAVVAAGRTVTLTGGMRW